MNTLSITLLTAIAPIILGTTYFLTTEFLPPNQPFLNAAIRCLPAGIVLLSLFGRKVDRNSLKRLLVLSILNISLFQSMLFISAYHLPGGLATLIGSFQPIIILLIAFVLKGDTVSRRNLIFIILSILGISLTFINNSLEVNTVGVSAAIIGSLSMSLGTFLSREWSTKINIYAFTGYQLALGGLALLFISPFFDTYPTNFEAKNIYGYLYLIFLVH
ncbi:DMT family transporter [Vibrio diazotrophicus]|uniref:DMT family transporter n=1 Tax=Vibrio diazotrophicus TaxID=685 RepID=UPI000694F993|nr:DMT family transporter [Vibrio diazotrophicus]